jgi:Xylanase inhibitor C-terminal
VQSTPLVKHNEFTVYSVKLTGITVGLKYIPVKNSPVRLKSNAALIDSGATFSYLLTPLIKQVKRAFIEQVKLPLADPMEIPGFDLCFKTNRWVRLPLMAFHFEGGAKMILPQDNYFRSDPENKLLCMMIVRDRETNTIGNIMQMDMQIIYDLDNMRLSFAPTDCDNI